MEGMKHQVTYLSSDYLMELIHYPSAQISAFLTGIRLRIAGVCLRFLLYLILLYFYFSYNNPQVQMLPLKSYSCSCLFLSHVSCSESVLELSIMPKDEDVLQLVSVSMRFFTHILPHPHLKYTHKINPHILHALF